ncbi:MAG: GGDEF domain-containing protein [Coriobacteriales bacterium]|nr:GGDEF domain-containing protein [Coriobacteriales bacterium]
MQGMEEGWIGDELDMSAFVPTLRLSISFDCGLVLITLAYMALYFANGMTWLLVCGVICLLMLAVSFVYVFKGPDLRYVLVNIIEITFFMAANVMFLGTACGFQLYVFGFLASTMLLSLSAGGKGKVVLPTKILIAILVVFYAVITLWFGHNTPYYAFESQTTVDILLLFNSLTTMATIVLFTGVYMATAASLAERLEQAALHDTLTGLLNRRGFYPYVAKSYERNAGAKGRCCLAMLDIDHFKEINDTYGHDAGDAVLKHLAEVFGEYAKDWPGLHACRWGGEEFLLTYDFDKADEAHRRCPFDELRETMANAVVVYDGQTIRWTVTIGVADYAEGTSPDDIISLSDKRLYQGKQAGRNRVVCGS